MEGFITLIIIIVVFNIFNMLLRALKGDKAPARQRVLVTAEQFLQDNIQKKEAHQTMQEETSYQTKPDKDVELYYTSDKEEISYLDGPGPIPGPGPKKTPAIKTAERKPDTLNSNLQQVLTKRDPLLAAFVFHEILEPPPALRRKR